MQKVFQNPMYELSVEIIVEKIESEKMYTYLVHLNSLEREHPFFATFHIK